MSNEQLAALLSKYAMILERALLDLESELPESMSKVGGLKNFASTQYEYFPATSGLHEVLNAINADVAMLSAGKDNVITGA